MTGLAGRAWTDDEIKGALSGITTLALTMYGEGRGDWRQGNSSVEERIAIGCVVRNRLPRFMAFGAHQNSYADVCLAPGQFSCWSPAGGDANYAALMVTARKLVTGLQVGDPLLDESIYLAQGIVAGVILDRTKGAVNYYAPAAMKPAGRVPSWAVGRTGLAIGAQLFFDASVEA